MIKFFRTIRQKLLSEGRTGKYFKYAFGEILLVVIGILIALGINNWNQDRVKQKEIESILMAIQDEIVADLHYSNNRVLPYVERDSLKNRILNKQITYDELKSGETNLLWFSQHRFLFSMRTAGYDQLMDNIDDLPKAYNHLLNLLNRHYRGGTLVRTRVKLDIYNVVQDYKKHLTEHQAWYGQDRYHGTISDAQIEFYLNDPYFLNHITRLNDAINRSIYELVNWRFLAIRIFHEINDLLGENRQEVPDIARNTSLTSASEASKYVGTYVLIKGPRNNAYGSKIEVIADDKDLLIQNGDEDQPRKLMIMHETKPWYVVRRSAKIFRFDHNGRNTLSIIRGNNDQTSWVKVEDN